MSETEKNTTAEQQSAEAVKETENAVPKKKAYMVFNPGALTCFTETEGLRFDFNYGARVQVPKKDWRVRLVDRDTCTTLYDMKAQADNVIISSTKKYYINFRIEAYNPEGELILAHDFDLRGKKVLIKYPVGTMGDIIAWFPYAKEFKDKHGCEVYCAMAENLAELFAPSYPDLHFIKPEERPEGLYASYYMGIFFPCDDRVHQPVDWRIAGLQLTIPYLLGLPVKEIKPKIAPTNKHRKIKEPYVCIASQATSQAKYWNNPTGWMEVIAYLKDKGYRILCIDKERCHGSGSRWNTIPYGAEDFTGDIPLTERVNLLYHADFFIGLSSGLSWLAWAVGRPVVLVSGFSLPTIEFDTPYRVINYHACNGCFSDSSIEFVHNDFAWCPRQAGTDRQFECTRVISSGQVCKAVDKLMADYGLKP